MSVVTSDRFAKGMSFEQYVAYTGTPENLQREDVRGSAAIDEMISGLYERLVVGPPSK
ncbi:MAG TPA: hypothetical protein VEL48_04325 [Candidatus Acidoferrales bacterium]|nr:hypothetical protein [Candidatus Acidoferrales bacterium]